MTQSSERIESSPAFAPRAASWLALLGWLALTSLAAGIGGLASINARADYDSLSQPGWAPPGWVFGPVWTLLYLMMAVAAWLVWRVRAVPTALDARRRGLGLFVVQLALNALWTWLFFAWRQGAWAFAEILVLWAAIAFTARLFGRVRRVAGLLLLPYLGWVTFAAALTWTVWRSNPGRL